MPSAASALSDLKNLFFSGTAVYIGEDFVDVARAEQTFSGMKVTYLQRFPVLQNIRETDSMDGKSALDRVLERAFPEDAARPARIAVNLKNDFFLLRRFSLKEIPENELKHAIIFEAQKYVPYPIDDLIYSFKTCTKRRDGTDIVFAAAESKNVSTTAEYFRAMNMLPGVIEPTPLLIARALGFETKIKKDAAYMSLHYEPSNKVIITEIHHSHAHSFREVRILPTEEGFKTTELAYPSIKDVLPLIQNDVIGSMEFLRKETKKEIEAVFLSGFYQSSEEEAVSKEFGVPFERLTMPFLKGEDAAIENKDRYVPALALLYDSMHRPFLNLAPPDIVSRDLWALKLLAGRMVIALSVIVAVHLALVGVNASELKKIEKARQNYEVYKVINPSATREDVLRYKNILETKAKFIDGMLTKRISLTEKLIRLGGDITPNSWIDDLSYTSPLNEKRESRLRLVGAIYAGAEAGISDAKMILESIKQDETMMGGFKEIKLSSVKKKRYRENEITEFEILLE